MHEGSADVPICHPPRRAGAILRPQPTRRNAPRSPTSRASPPVCCVFDEKPEETRASANAALRIWFTCGACSGMEGILCAT